MELEAQVSHEVSHETQALLHEAPTSSRLGGVARAAIAVGATALLAVGGKKTLSGTSASVFDVIGADGGGCSRDGDDCDTTRCCQDGRSTCWRKNEHWASCNHTCSPKNQWNSDTNAWEETDEDVWLCEQLSPAHDGENCLYSNECVDHDSHCFRKNDHWASCNKTCSPKNKWNSDTNSWEQTDEDVWDCHILSAADDGMNCMESKKCKKDTSECYQKNDHWASCNETCSPNNKWNDETNSWEQTDEKVWDCNQLSCTEDGDNCMMSGCCTNELSTCFKKNDHWASCNSTCTASYMWTGSGWEDQGEGEKVWDCTVVLPKPTEPDCDVSGCNGCSGEQCQYCREEKERDCCLDQACKAASGEQHQKCREDNMATCCEGKTGHCMSSNDPAPTTAPTAEPCDVSGCDGCSGEQCQYCREEKERDCCLDDACKAASGEQHQKCREDNMETCCEGKTGHCMPSNETAPTTAPTAEPCDVSGCDGCSGEQCQYCREEKERDCCLDDACKAASGEQHQKCREDNMETCCEGKTGHCMSSKDTADAI